MCGSTPVLKFEPLSFFEHSNSRTQADFEVHFGGGIPLFEEMFSSLRSENMVEVLNLSFFLEVWEDISPLCLP